MASGPDDFDLLAASLRAELSDISAFTEGLAVKLEQSLPGNVTVERERQGLTRKPTGPVRRIEVEAGGDRLELRNDRNRIETLRAHVSGGIVLKTQQIGIDDWLTALAAALRTEAQHSERTRQTLEQLLLGGRTEPQ